MPTPANLVHQSSTTAGTGNFTLAPVVGALGKQDFSEAFGIGGSDVFDYFIMNREAKEWEVGTGHLLDASTLVRDTVVENSNGDTNPVSFSAGTKDCTNDVTALNSLSVDEGLLGRTLYLDADKDTSIAPVGDDQVTYNVGSISVETHTPTRVSEGVGWEAKANTVFSGDISPPIIITDTHDWNPTGWSTATVIRIQSDAIIRSITGLAGGEDGRIAIFHNVGSFSFRLPSQDTNSLDANRFLFDADNHVHPNASIILQYDATTSRWRSIGRTQNEPQSFVVKLGDETSDITTGVKTTIRMPYAFRLFDGNLGVRASLVTAATGSVVTFDVKQNSVSILSTLLTIDAGETSSKTAASEVVISTEDLTDDAEIEFEITTIGSTTAGQGPSVTLIGIPF